MIQNGSHLAQPPTLAGLHQCIGMHMLAGVLLLEEKSYFAQRSVGQITMAVVESTQRTRSSGGEASSPRSIVDLTFSKIARPAPWLGSQHGICKAVF